MLTWTRHEPKHGSVYYTASHGNQRYTVQTFAPSTPARGWWWYDVDPCTRRSIYGTAQEAMAAVESIVRNREE